MKTKEEILDSKICTLEYGHYVYNTVIDAMSEVEQQTREEMFLFIDQLINYENLLFPDGNNRWLFFEKAEDLTDDDLGHLMSINHVFDYWKSLKK